MRKDGIWETKSRGARTISYFLFIENIYCAVTANFVLENPLSILPELNSLSSTGSYICTHTNRTQTYFTFTLIGGGDFSSTAGVIEATGSVIFNNDVNNPFSFEGSLSIVGGIIQVETISINDFNIDITVPPFSFNLNTYLGYEEFAISVDPDVELLSNGDK